MAACNYKEKEVNNSDAEAVASQGIYPYEPNSPYTEKVRISGELTLLDRDVFFIRVGSDGSNIGDPVVVHLIEENLEVVSGDDQPIVAYSVFCM